jgi:hypothetical protein
MIGISRLDILMMKLALGKDQVHAKYAARYITNSRNKEKNSAALIDVSYGVQQEELHTDDIADTLP